jgi:hypothetical protein
MVSTRATQEGSSNINFFDGITPDNIEGNFDPKVSTIASADLNRNLIEELASLRQEMSRIQFSRVLILESQQRKTFNEIKMHVNKSNLYHHDEHIKYNLFMYQMKQIF